MKFRRGISFILGIGMVFSGAVTPVRAVYAEENDVAINNETGIAIASLDGVEYDGLDALFEALNADMSGAEHEVKFLSDVSAGGYKILSGRNVVFDLQGHTFTVGPATVGSTGTETNAFQLLKDSTIEFKNGTIVAPEQARIFFQNYSNLTLRDLTIDGRGARNLDYAVSNNNGLTQILGETNILVPEGGGARAFDACWGPKVGYPDGAQVIVDTTGEVQGDIEMDVWGAFEEPVKTTLEIRNGRFSGEFIIDERMADNLTVSGGYFSVEPDTEALSEEVEVENFGTEEAPIYGVVPKTVELNGFGYGGDAAVIDIDFSEAQIFDRKAELQVQTVEDEEVLGLDEGIFRALDINILDRNGLVEVSDTEMAIKVKLDEAEQGFDKYYVLYIDEGGVKEKIPAEVDEEGYLKFTTSHLSIYALAGENEEEVEIEAVVPKTPNTGAHR